MRENRFKQPPPADPLAAARDSSLVFRLNSGFFLRQLGIFLMMDFLLLVLTAAGLIFWAESRCAGLAELVEEFGVPTQEVAQWMEAGEYTITPLARPAQGLDLPIPERWVAESLHEALRSVVQPAYYVVEVPNQGEPYAIALNLYALVRIMRWAAAILLLVQGFSLLTNLLGNHRAIRKVLRPIQDMAATTLRLNSMTSMSRQELKSLTGELEKITARHLDNRIDLPATQKELRVLAKAINAMLDRVNQAYSAQMQFVSDASHELRTPIAVIYGYAALLDRWGKDDPAALQESISAIRAEAEAMEQLVEQLLFLARGDNDSQPVQAARVNLTQLAGEVLREEEMINPNRTFVLEGEEQPLMVQADSGLMKQVMRILMDNSVKYSPETGRIYLRLTQADGHARVTVQDEGMGISREGIPHIFDRFYRTDRSRDRKTGGTGLGLSIAKWIVERHGGWFEVVSRIDIGTRMTFLIPLAK